MSSLDYGSATAPLTISPNELLDTIIAMLKADQPLMIWSAPGLGKSSVTRLAARLTNHVYHAIYLAVMERIDTMGLPIVRNDRTTYAVPDFLPPTDSDSLHLVNLEELPNAKQDMFTAIYGLVLERRIGEYHLPPGARIIACGNRVKDRGGAHRLPPALASRFLHVDLEPNVDDWVDWALDNDIDTDVISYLTLNPESLHDYDPTREEQPFPCPRTWESVSRIKPHIEHLDPRLQKVLYRGDIGENAANSFTAFLAMKDELPHPRTVLLNPDSALVPENASAKVAVARSLCRMADEFNMDAVCTYADRLGKEVGEYLVSQSLRLNPAVENTDGYVRWASRTR